ncbi:hypothetical protein [Deinococcus sp. QL22]|uniref:hypothetical protein n=1 Tax=Deinococcus sp. QL22 TaxID=2939437 RepID=UPI002017B686|nr:hypothetical protein [Deinococcus sp. QL22]UQN09379.1 hypothetical protein M1R55_22735 [Deinococcus sp. QL22]
MKLSLVVAALSGLLVVQWLAPLRPRGPQAAPGMHASWVNVARSLDEAVKLSQTVVVARVVGVKRASDLTVKAAGEPNGVDRVPVERVLLEVQALYGSAPQQVTLFHTGLSTGQLTDQTPPEKAPDLKPTDQAAPTQTSPRTTLLEDDPEYKEGQQYVLFLRPGPELDGEKTLRVIAPEGRYLLEGQRLMAVTTRGAAKEIAGLSLSQLAARLKALSATRFPTGDVQLLPNSPLVPVKPPPP